MFVVDTCQDEADFISLKEILVMSLSLLPSHALVGLTTFGTYTQVHELSHDICPKSHIFRGDRECPQSKVKQLLGLGPCEVGTPGNRVSGKPAASRFFVQVSAAGFQLARLFEGLKKDPWPVSNDRRPLRCTGVAVSVASGLLETLFSNSGARIMVFVAGPATYGPGMIVGNLLKDPIRSHKDIGKDGIKVYKKANKYYEALATRTANSGHVVDLFVGSLDQVGLLEMKALPNFTGGHAVLTDSFTSSMFKQSFVKVFEVDVDESLRMGFQATLEVRTSNDLKVSGLIGPAIPIKSNATNISHIEVGLGGTNVWKICGITPSTSVAAFFEIALSSGQEQTQQHGLIQFSTYYQHSSGRFHLRVTTIGRRFAGPGDPSFPESFDQETAAVLIARVAAHKAEGGEDGADVLRWVDRMLIRLCSHFANYTRDAPESFRLAKHFGLYPQFMYNLRRSQFLQVFNNSPDETAFYRHVLDRADVGDSLVMIQPTLDSYTFDTPGVPVLLDSSSILSDHILLLDTFFHVLIFHGETVALWQKERYQDKEEHENFKELLQAPRDDARVCLHFDYLFPFQNIETEQLLQELIQDRFPLPRYIVCDAGDSQARFLLSKINPSVPWGSVQPGMAASQYYCEQQTNAQMIFTDDVSLQTFMEHLRRYVCTG